MPRLLTKEVGHTCTPNSRTSLAHVGKRAFELAQEHSITNSRLTLGSALVLGGALGLTQVQSAKAAEWIFNDALTFASAAASADAQVDATPNEMASIIFSGASAETINIEAGVSFTREVTIGDAASSRFTLAPADGFTGQCLICSTSSITLNNVVLDLTNKAQVVAVLVGGLNPAPTINVTLNDVEVTGVHGAPAILVAAIDLSDGEAIIDTTVTINNSLIHSNEADTVIPDVFGEPSDIYMTLVSSVIGVVATGNATVTISGDTTIENNISGIGTDGTDGTADTSGTSGTAGGSIITVISGGDATVTISDNVNIIDNTSSAGGVGGDSGDSGFSSGVGGAGGSVILVRANYYNGDGDGAATLTISDTVTIDDNASGEGGAGGVGEWCKCHSIRKYYSMDNGIRNDRWWVRINWFRNSTCR